MVSQNLTELSTFMLYRA